MSKLIFILWAVFFVSTANAIKWSKHLAKYEQRARTEIDDAVAKVEGKWNDGDVGGILDVLDAIDEEWMNTVNFITRQTNDEISNFAEGANGVNVSECIEYSPELYRKERLILGAMRECASDYLLNKHNVFDDFAAITDNALGELWYIKADAARCNHDVDNLAKAVEAISCSRAVQAEATRISDQYVLSYIFIEVEWKKRMTFFREYIFNECKEKSGFSTTGRRYQDLVSNVTECIKWKIAEDKATTVSPSVSTDTPEKPRSLHWIPPR